MAHLRVPKNLLAQKTTKAIAIKKMKNEKVRRLHLPCPEYCYSLYLNHIYLLIFFFTVLASSHIIISKPRKLDKKL